MAQKRQSCRQSLVRVRLWWSHCLSKSLSLPVPSTFSLCCNLRPNSSARLLGFSVCGAVHFSDHMHTVRAVIKFALYIFFYIFPDPGWMVFKNNLICVEYVPQGWGLPQGNSRLLYLSERLCFTLTQDNKNRGQKKLKGSQTWLNISQKTVKIGQKNKWWWVEQKRPNINQNYVRNSYIKKLKMNQITKWYVGKWLKVKHSETRSNRSKIQLNT